MKDVYLSAALYAAAHLPKNVPMTGATPVATPTIVSVSQPVLAHWSVSLSV